jgi:HSP20 family protein
MTESSDSPSQALTPVPVSSPSSAEPRAASHAATEQQVFTPPIDIFETADGLVLLADLPGVSSESLELQVQDNKLTLFGRVVPAIPEGARLLHSEYRVGHFLRSFILSDDVDHERITARLNHGVLEVVLPRAPRPEPRRIRVSTDSPPPKAP